MKKHLKIFVSFALLSLLVFLGAPALGAQAFGFGDSEEEPEGAAAGAGPASIGSVVGGLGLFFGEDDRVALGVVQAVVTDGGQHLEIALAFHDASFSM